ncbi:hypothetical protein EGW08_016527, partial [Elysia chlorotica]
QVSAAINQYLRDYQREGIRFLFERYLKGTGAILGDDMGLGKTVQVVIGFLSALLGKTGRRIDTVHAVPKFIKQMSNDFPDTPPKRATRPFLIIGPTAVLYNWLDELNTWGYFTVGKFHGSEKDGCFDDLKKGKLEIVITTFETFRDKVEQLNQIEWEAVIVDEVHKIKGLRAQVTQAMRIIRTPCRFGLTGTALQNNMTELWSLLDWAQPKVLGSLEQFQSDFVRAIEIGQKHDATKRELAHARKQRDKFASIRKKMLLRRTKKLIADQLPNKEELVVMCRLTELQVSVYKAILGHPDMCLVLQAEDPCDCTSGKQRASCCYKLLDIIEHYIISQGHEYSRIDGKVSGQKRRDIVLQFNTDPSLFICLISTKAGGLGLNLTGANKVVIYDPNWNPSHDLQAQDRAYRIGQTRDVKVFRLVSAGTIEENIYLRQIYKQQLDEVAISSINARRYFHGVQGDKSNQGELFGVKNMFALRTGNVCLTMDILKRNERLEKGLAGYDITKYVLPKRETKGQNDTCEEEEEDVTKESFSDYENDEKEEKEEKEEDEHFLRDIFGLDHIDLKPSSSTALDLTTAVNQIIQAMNTFSESSDSDGEFSLIPLRSRHKQTRQNTRMEDNLGKGTPNNSIQRNFQCSEASPSQGPVSEECRNASVSTVSNAFDELFDMSDITFSTARAPAKCSNAADKYNSTKHISMDKKRHVSSKSTGLSWLFPESEDESDSLVEEIVKDQTGQSKKASSSLASGKKQVANTSTLFRKRVQIQNPHGKSRSKSKTGTSKTTRIKTTFSSEQSFLAGSDILHTHINTGVLGSSRAEDHMTRCAIKDVYELNTNTQAPALVCDPLSQPDNEEEGDEKEAKGKGGKRKKTRSSQESEEHYDQRQSINAGKYKLLVGQTPPAIARRQFSELAHRQGMSELDFANYVTQTSLSCRLDMLKEFYTQKHSKDVVTEAVTKLYSLTSKPGTAAGHQDGNTSGTKTSNTNQQTPHKCPPSRTDASSDTGRQGKSLSRPSPRKLTGKQMRSSRTPTPFLLEPCTYASDSQESITARSPVHCQAEGEASVDPISYLRATDQSRPHPNGECLHSRPECLL